MALMISTSREAWPNPWPEMYQAMSIDISDFKFHMFD
jgi:hypothetical protein